MPIRPTYPGIFIEEQPSSAHPIVPASTSVTVFVGYTDPSKTMAFDTAVRIRGFTDFEREFGGFFTSGVIDTSLPKAVYEFFLNGGSEAYVVALKASGESAADYIGVFDEGGPLDTIAIFNLLVLPGVFDGGVWSDALACCERRRAFAILDPPSDAVLDPSGPQRSIADVMDTLVPKSANGALYFPYVLSPNPSTRLDEAAAPGGFVAGIYARTDATHGVWKAPAGVGAIVHDAVGVVPSGRVTDARQDMLSAKGVNCIRTFPAFGTIVFGARTLASENPAPEEWRYVPVRRLALFIEQSLYAGLGWAEFEPNGEPLWAALRTTIEEFMVSLFKEGALAGATASAAFFVKCDGTTTTQDDVDRGIANITVGFAPVKPAEFVILEIAVAAGR